MGIDKPDWERYVTAAGSQLAPVGDSNRWGAVATARITSPGGIGVGEIDTTQFIQAATLDRYSRSWSLSGSLMLPSAIWAVVVSPTPVSTVLEVSQGVGQATVLHNIVLNVGGIPTAGLCNTQNITNGGVYLPAFSGPGNIFEERPFAAIGALVGKAINIRARFITFGVVPTAPFDAIVKVILTPYAAGQGL